MTSSWSLKKLRSEIDYLSQLTNTVVGPLPDASSIYPIRPALTAEYNRLLAIKQARFPPALYPTGVSYTMFRGEYPPDSRSMKKASEKTFTANLIKVATIVAHDPAIVALVSNPTIRRAARLGFYETLRNRLIADRMAQMPPPAPVVAAPVAAPIVAQPAVIHMPVAAPEDGSEEKKELSSSESEEEEKATTGYFDALGHFNSDYLAANMRMNQIRHPHQRLTKLDAIGFYETYVPPLNENENVEALIDIAERMAVGIQLATAGRYPTIDLNAHTTIKITYHFKKMIQNTLTTIAWATKKFEGPLLDINEMIDKINSWMHTVYAPESEGMLFIDAIRVFVIARPAGACNKSRKEGSKRIGEFHITDRPSADNNCFFVSARELFGLTRVGSVWCNGVRETFTLPNDSAISSINAIAILDRMASTQNWRLWSFDLPLGKHEHIVDEALPVHELRLDNTHWTKCEYNPQKKCGDCGREYYNEHKCNPKMVSYHMAKVRKYGPGQEAPKFILPKMQREAANTQDYMIHFDLETMPDEKRIHQAYAVGYAAKIRYSDGEALQSVYRGHRGAGCMRRFILDVIEIAASEPEQIFYLNAYNGAKFDMYPLFRELLDMKINIKNFVVNCGAIIILEFANIKIFDMYKHCQGDLRTNLINAKCEVLKGDIDHDKIAEYGSYENIPDELKKDIDTYLRADVLGLKELFEKVNAVVYEKYGVNMTSAISTSQLTFKIWTRSLGNTVIQLPTLEQEKDFRQAVVGARCYKTKHSYTSVQFLEYMAGHRKFEEITDFQAFIDVVSLYPASMAHNVYPTGPCFKMLSNEAESLDYTKIPIGIYNVDYIANKNILHAPCGVKDPVKKSLHWDLKDEVNIFRTSVDIENMIKRGYRVTINHGWYWKTSAPIFKEYIEELYKVKDKAAKDSPEYTLAKLWMNGLYGKMIQRPIYEKTEIITSNAGYWAFWGKHEITDITEIDEDRWSVSGVLRQGKEQVKCITKPTHLGAFILAYSRRIMMNYMIESNPEDKPEDDWDYTDTDSFCVPARCAKLIKRYNGGTLGDIDDDCGHGAKVLRAVYIAPKLYEIWYALPPGTKMKGGKVAEESKVYRKFAAKGLEKRDLPTEKFEVMANGGVVTTTKSFTFKKIGLSRNSKQENIPMFSVQHAKADPVGFIGPVTEWGKSLTREANKTAWKGRHFIGNTSLPHGHASIII